ncbi:MAG TPA: restriction endonuclease [Candidatus Atribacteria bacterium]|nr:restriction endonuclease [Candidatus Atribacteria bacterium]
MKGRLLYNPSELNREFNRLFNQKNWNEVRYTYYVTTNYSIMQELISLPLEKQKEFLIKRGVTSPILSYKQTDFVKENIAIEVQFGKYAFVAYDLFVKHLLFYTGGVINVGIEILPVKSMQSEMSSGVAYYEGEVYNILRHGRNSPPVPLLIMGIAP